MITQQLKKKRSKNPVCSYLRKLISPYGFGWKGDDGVGRYSNETLIRYYNTSGFMGSPTNDELHNHFTGQDTLYFWADGRKSTPLILSMIDIDCHRSGNPESAKAFADWLTANYFPCLYHEPSTNGKGRHGYFVLFVAVHRCSCGYPPPSQGEEPCAKSRKRLLWRLITVIPSTARPNGFGRESTAMTPRLFRPRAGVGRRPSPETVAVRLLEGGEPVV